ncbi:hypothetical protein [Nocardiopsis rhodophaea]|uniref:hypothetical protein n=1 Tax=Nocardiopsis rhodophaea TaxID=280238 RepID=UPI0031CFB7AD
MLATLDDWGRYFDVPPPPHAPSLLAAACQNIIDFCGWPIERHTVEEEYDGHGGRVLTLHTMRLREVHGVRVDGQPVNDFRVSRRYAQIRHPTAWPEGFGRIIVSYTAGYEPVPDNIAALAVGLASRAASVPAGVVSETVDRLTVRYAQATKLDPLDEAALERYRLGARP